MLASNAESQPTSSIRGGNHNSAAPTLFLEEKSRKILHLIAAETLCFARSAVAVYQHLRVQPGWNLIQRENVYVYICILAFGECKLGCLYVGQDACACECCRRTNVQTQYLPKMFLGFISGGKKASKVEPCSNNVRLGSPSLQPQSCLGAYCTQSSRWGYGPQGEGPFESVAWTCF